MKLAPQRMAACIDTADSIIAWPSGTFDDVNAPEQRSGRPTRRASWPTTSEPSAGSGVPKVGEPDCAAPSTTGSCRR